MADIEKIIKGIDICLQRFRCWEDCPYYNTEKIGCMEQLREDALALLKQIEKPKFLVHEDGTIEPLPKIVRCKDCKHFDKSFSYCATRGYCDISSIRHEDDWFCADGERRDAD